MNILPSATAVCLALATVVCAAEPRAQDDWRLERSLLPDRELKPDEKVFSLDVDLDGDGIVEHLFTDSEWRNGRLGNIWSVTGDRRGKYRHLGSAVFRPDACAVFVEPDLSPAPRLYAYSPMTMETGSLLMFTVRGGETIAETVKTVAWSDYEARFAKPPPIRSRLSAEVAELYPKEKVASLWESPSENRATPSSNQDKENAVRLRGAEPFTGNVPALPSSSWPLATLLTLTAAGLILLLRSKRRTAA